MADNSLLIKISAETKEFKDKIDEIKGSTEDLTDALGETAKVSGLVFAGLVAAGGIAIHAFGDAEKSSKLLTQTLQNQGLAGKDLEKTYKDMAAAISEKTGVDDDAIVKGQALLQTFIGQTEITPELAAAMVDLAEKTGSLDSAAEILGRGIEGNVRGLKQFGITIDDSLTKEERLAAITEQVSQKFGGLAASSNTGVGSVKGLQTAFGNFLEQVGQRLAPVFEEIVLGLTVFFNRLNENKPLLDFIFETGKIAAIIAGTITTFATAAITIVKLQQAFAIAQAAVTAFGLASKIAIGATGIGLLLIVIAEIALNWEKIWPVLLGVYNTFVNNIGKTTTALATLLSGVFSFNPSRIRDGIAQVQAIVNEGFKNINDAAKASTEEEIKSIQDPRKAAAAQKVAQDKIEAERRAQETIRAERELATLSAEQASEEAIALKQKEVEVLKQIQDEKFRSDREALQAHLEQIRALQDQQFIDDNNRRFTFNEEVLANNAEFQALDVEQQQLFLERHGAALQASIDTEDTAKQKALQKSLQDQIAANNRFLAEQEKYGTAYATINKVTQSEEVQGFAKATSQLTQLTQSKNATLKTIGKAAAVADITIKTAQAAIAIYSGFAAIPIVGPALGVAGAAAAVAFGAEQISNVVSAQSGGVVPGANTGGDSVPSILQAGEFVVPRANFEEVVSAVADRRSADSSQATSGVTSGGGGASGSVRVELGFSGDNAEKFLTARQVEARSLGTLRESAVTA